jgi:glutamine transport system substrate-binding protein
MIILKKRNGVLEMKKIGTVLFATVLAFSLSACGNGASNSNKAADTAQPAKKTESVKKYAIGTDATYPPFEFEKDGKYVGIDIELINAIAKEEGFEVDLKPMNFKGIIPAITAKQLDAAIAGISITDERKQVVNLSDPYYTAGLSLIVREDNTTIKSTEDLKGKTIAIKKGTSGAKLADELGKKYGAQVKYFDDSPSMYQEVANKNADVTIEDFPVISYKIAIDPNSKLKIVGDRLNGDLYGIAVSKDNADLLNKINDGLKKLKDNGKYDQIIKTYMAASTK